MNCPICSQETRVLRKDATERRRQCIACGHRFTTTEISKDEHQRQQQAVEAVMQAAEKLRDAA